MASTRKRYSLLLINPARKYRYQWDMHEACATMGKRSTASPLALPLIAAFTPGHYDIRIIDEEIEPLRVDDRPDLVGITALVSNINRAYEIADTFQADNVPVIMGGPQVSFSVEESLRHADCVVRGEAETIWEQCLEDFEQGCLKRSYKESSVTDFAKSPIPRWDLVKTDRIMTSVVQVSRGCPFRCDFCVVPLLFGRKLRYRDLDNVIEEIESLPVREIAFADDNLTADKKYARRLMRRLEPLKVTWSCQAGIDTARDKELLGMMARAGCMSILFGFESINTENLREANKQQNVVEEYRQIIENVHGAGIQVIASFLVGFDADTLETFDQIYGFTQENNLSYVMLNSLSPYPGSGFHKRMAKCGRTMHIDTELLNGIFPTMRYRNISGEDMFLKGLSTLEKIYSYENLCKKGPAVLGNGAFSNEEKTHTDLSAKILGALKIMKDHIFTTDSHKRRLLLNLMGLVRDKATQPPDIFRYLLFMTSLHGFLQSTRERKQDILAHIRETDWGALKDNGWDEDVPDNTHHKGGCSMASAD
ncbi:MAG: radical SAM protein [Pseudomonadota bacterium]